MPYAYQQPRGYLENSPSRVSGLFENAQETHAGDIRTYYTFSTDVGEDNKGTSKFDQLYNKHIRNHSSNHDGKVISKNVEKKKEQEEEEENIDGTTPTTPYHD